MPRRIAVQPRSPFAPGAPEAAGRGAAGAGPPRAPRAPVPRGWGFAARILIAPFAAALAAIAGLVYVLLLPVCGIASVASAIAQACWRTLRGATRGGNWRTALRR
jgi:hypothetical protein